MARAQTKLVFQLGYPVQNVWLELELARFASLHCGGCTTSTKTGWWCPDGADAKLTFNSTAIAEHTFEIELTCEPHKFATVLEAMKLKIATAARAHSIEIAWIHVTETEVIGHHFHIEDIWPPKGAILSDNAMRMSYDAPSVDFHTQD